MSPSPEPASGPCRHSRLQEQAQHRPRCPSRLGIERLLAQSRLKGLRVAMGADFLQETCETFSCSPEVSRLEDPYFCPALASGQR